MLRIAVTSTNVLPSNVVRWIQGLTQATRESAQATAVCDSPVESLEHRCRTLVEPEKGRVLPLPVARQHPCQTLAEFGELRR